MKTDLIVEIFVKLIHDYFVLMEQSDIIKTIANKQNILHSGVNLIINIFKMNIVYTKNIKTTFDYCSKACYCYLEYIEQIYKTEILNKINISDVMMFVYKETILLENESHVNDESDIIISDEVHVVLQRLAHNTNILIYWKSQNVNIDEKIEITNHFLLKYLMYEKIDLFAEYLEIILEKSDFSKSEYLEFLNLFYKRMQSCKVENKSEFIREKILEIRDICEKPTRLSGLVKELFTVKK